MRVRGWGSRVSSAAIGSEEEAASTARLGYGWVDMVFYTVVISPTSVEGEFMRDVEVLLPDEIPKFSAPFISETHRFVRSEPF